MKKKLTKNIDILRLNLQNACREFNRRMRFWWLDDEGTLCYYGEDKNPLMLWLIIEQIKEEIKELESKK